MSDFTVYHNKSGGHWIQITISGYSDYCVESGRPSNMWRTIASAS